VTIVLRTGRLDLRPLPAAVAALLPGYRDDAARLLGSTLPAGWPAVDLLDVLPMQAAAGPDGERFGIWVMVERPTNEVVGDIGFLGPPDDGAVELGYSVVPGRRGRGFATEAARAMADWALAQAGINAVIARCDADNVASVRVLRAAGFVRTDADAGEDAGSDAGQLCWRRTVAGGA
jgi:[ribosomal protein S5]-alanine N-acetyltransferase